MLDKIVLKNFQSHKDTVLELHPGVNTIIGTSDGGKSSIIRAIGLVQENKPDGDAFVSHWLRNKKDNLTGNAEVVIETGNHVVTRVKGKVNQYLLDGEEMTAFGRGGIPEAITSALNLSDLNYQGQSDNFFMLRQTPGEVVKMLNRYVDLEIIDQTLSRADSAIRKIRQEQNSKAEQVKDLEGKLLHFEEIGLDDLSHRYDIIVADQSKRDEQGKQAHDLGNLIHTHNSISEMLKSFSSVKDTAKLLSAVNLLNDKHTRIASKVENLDELVHEITSVNTALGRIGNTDLVKKKLAKVTLDSNKRDKLVKDTQSLQSILDKLDEVCYSIEEVEKLESIDVESVLEASLERFETTKKSHELSELIEKLSSLNSSIRDQKKRVRDLTKKYDQIKPETCPICGSPLHKEC